MDNIIAIIDFGGQYAHLIASRIRRLGVKAEIFVPQDINLAKKLTDKNIKGIILSGGPQSVFDKNSPHCDNKIFELKKPILGICYGHQYLAKIFGGEVKKGEKGEYGSAQFSQVNKTNLFSKIRENFTVWMNHRDEVSTAPQDFEITGKTPDCNIASMQNLAKNIYSVQFHLEVSHTENGNKILDNFLQICECQKTWNMKYFLNEQTAKIRENFTAENHNKKVLLFVSGGVDSTVCFVLLSKILGKDRVHGLFIDTGLLRKNEKEMVKKELTTLGGNLEIIDESELFLSKLKGIVEPEKKREIIGNCFLEAQRKYFTTHSLNLNSWILAQGTIYPDTIETGGTTHADTIKTHHNRVSEIQQMIDAGQVIEPIAELYKDEVRELGRQLHIPENLISRHPFPGPGLGVRILCNQKEIETNIEIKTEILGVSATRRAKNSQISFFTLPIKSVGVQGDSRTYRHPAVLIPNTETFLIKNLTAQATKLINNSTNINRVLYCLGKNFTEKFARISVKKCDTNHERIKTLQKADNIVMETLNRENLYHKVWQFPVVLAPISFNNFGEEIIILRPVNSLDAMTADVGDLPYNFYTEISREILKNKNISAVFLDITSKPPGTIEWE